MSVANEIIFSSGAGLVAKQGTPPALISTAIARRIPVPRSEMLFTPILYLGTAKPPGGKGALIRFKYLSILHIGNLKCTLSAEKKAKWEFRFNFSFRPITSAAKMRYERS
jgi:hypothetical protein